MFDPIESFLKKTYVDRLSGINETWRLTHVHLFGQGTIEESLLDVKLFNGPAMMEG